MMEYEVYSYVFCLLTTCGLGAALDVFKKEPLPTTSKVRIGNYVGCFDNCIEHAIGNS